MSKLIIRITLDGETRSVYAEDYIKAKTKQLQEFGYTNLTEETVRKQLTKVLAKDKNLDVIGGFIKEEVNI